MRGTLPETGENLEKRVKRMKIVPILAATGVVALLAGCAQQEEPMVRPQPVFDKFGGGSCEGEWIYVPGAAPEYAECVPPDECEPVYDTAGNLIECVPGRRPDPGRSDGTSSTSTPRPTAGARP
jgi:hypothetical protein